MVWIQLFRTHCEIREVGLLSKCKWIQMVLASNIHCITACLTGRQLAKTKVDWERSSACVSVTAPPSHRLVLVLPPGQDASRSSVEWNACHRPKSSAVPTVRLPFPPSLGPPSSSASSTESGGSRHVRRTARRLQLHQQVSFSPVVDEKRRSEDGPR